MCVHTVAMRAPKPHGGRRWAIVRLLICSQSSLMLRGSAHFPAVPCPLVRLFLTPSYPPRPLDPSALSRFPANPATPQASCRVSATRHPCSADMQAAEVKVSKSSGDRFKFSTNDMTGYGLVLLVAEGKRAGIQATAWLVVARVCIWVGEPDAWSRQSRRLDVYMYPIPVAPGPREPRSRLLRAQPRWA